jgi:hypothetical protein
MDQRSELSSFSRTRPDRNSLPAPRRSKGKPICEKIWLKDIVKSVGVRNFMGDSENEYMFSKFNVKSFKKDANMKKISNLNLDFLGNSR